MSGNRVRSTCPLALYTHAKGFDSKPSFAVLVDTEGQSKFRCLSCNQKGDLSRLLMTLKIKAGAAKRHGLVDFYSGLYNWVVSQNAPSGKSLAETLANIKPQWSSTETASVQMGGGAGKLKEPEPLPESELENFEVLKGAPLDYLMMQRGLSLASIDDWELKWHAKAKRIAIPIRDLNGKLVGISGRSMDPNNKRKFMHSTGFKRDFYVYGENRCKRGRTGYLTEGFFDVQKLHQQGYNAFAVMGASVSTLQIEKILVLFSDVVIIPDGDDPGYKGAEDIHKRLAPRIKTSIVDTPRGKDPDDLTYAEVAKLLGPPNLFDDDGASS